jgi:ribosome biogenesis protein BRX1
VVLPLDKKKPDPSAATLVEVGPRFALQPIKIFSGSFGGPVLYDNAAYTPPNLIRRMIKQQKAGKYVAKVKARSKRREHLGEHQLSEDEVDAVFRG